MFRNRSVNVHQFAMVPRADIPRSSFLMEHTHKTTINSGFLYPIYVDEVLPGDTFNFHATIFGRMSTPLYPIMDNLYLETFFFFVPNRILWTNWKKFNGEQDNPGDSTSYLVPQITSPVGGYQPLTIFDYMGLPTVGQVGAGNTFKHNALHLRAYNLIWNEWFRDENLQSSVVVQRDDGPDTFGTYTLLRRGKRHDYFTGCLPWPQKGNAVTMPLGTSAPVKLDMNGQLGNVVLRASNRLGQGADTIGPATTNNLSYKTAGFDAVIDPNGQWYTDLSQATAATINSIRQAFQVQRLLERDARGGTRYTEILRSHFGVVSPDARLQRPEYLGGGMTPINVSPIAQTSGTPSPGGYTSTPLGNLAAMGTLVSQNNSFSQSFTEHGVIVGLCSIRADLTYQQGLRRMWSRQTRYDFYWPVFAHLGEQAVLNKEIFCDGSSNDDLAFGYQERWAEYRYNPSLITGLFRSTTAGTIDGWHLAQRFASLPTLNNTFISDTPPMSRVLAVGAAANGQEFILDSLFSIRVARPMPMYSVPGLIDHF